MPKIINTGKELLRISPKDARQLEYSRSDGRFWHLRGGRPRFEFEDLMVGNGELLAQTTDGLYYSKNNGLSWHIRKR